MELQVALFIFGALLFLIGLIGKIKIQEIEIGTNCKKTKLAMLLIGIFLMLSSFAFELWLSKSSEFSQEPFHTEEVNPDSSMVNTKVAQATLKFWNSF